MTTLIDEVLAGRGTPAHQRTSSTFGQSTNTVYVAYGTAEEPLYVGCSADYQARLHSHKARSPWWGEMSRVETHGPFGRAEALQLERHLIWTLGPVYNQPPSKAKFTAA